MSVNVVKNNSQETCLCTPPPTQNMEQGAVALKAFWKEQLLALKLLKKLKENFENTSDVIMVLSNLFACMYA